MVAEIFESTVVRKVHTITKNGHENTEILEEYSDKKASLSYAPNIIVCGKNVYVLNYPLRCLLEKEEESYMIICEMLDIIGTGLSIDEAEESFAQEFDYIYQRYNQLSNDKLTKRLQEIKTILNIIVKS